MKKLITVAFVLALSWSFTSTQAQSPEYPDLLKMYVDAKYERCLYKADKYTIDEKTKKDPLPWLYCSMCYLQLSKDPNMTKKYPDAFKNAVKYAAKYGQRDKERAFAGDYIDYIEELRGLVIAEGEMNMGDGKFTKAKTNYASLCDLDNNDAGAYIMLGYVHTKLKAKKDSEIAFNRGRELLQQKKCNNLTKYQRGLLKEAIMRVAEEEGNTGNKTSAKAWLDLGLDLFKDDKEYQVTYQMVAG